MVILVKNGNFGQKWKFWSKMVILLEKQNFGKNGNFARKTKFWSKMVILLEKQNFGQKW